MAAKKFAISIPEEVMHEVDLAAKARNQTRSAFIASVLKHAARARSERALRQRIAAFFADRRLSREQSEAAEWYQALGNEAGTEW